MEHRLAGEQALDAHAVQPTDQFAGGVVDLDRVRPSELVQPGVGVDEVTIDPPALAGRLGAGLHHLAEAGVDLDVEPAPRCDAASG